mmetsp:Transcript_95281/g.246225  ORF Transcript_95281/g.246225 Transcript_95281/m.246225 type:complete len:316 (+) Transcript_95281:568-1515(+)
MEGPVGVVGGARQAEVEDSNVRGVRLDEQVAGLDVPMHDVRAVQGRQALEHLPAEGERHADAVLRAEALAADLHHASALAGLVEPLVQGDALAVLHLDDQEHLGLPRACAALGGPGGVPVVRGHRHRLARLLLLLLLLLIAVAAARPLEAVGVAEAEADGRRGRRELELRGRRRAPLARAPAAAPRQDDLADAALLLRHPRAQLGGLGAGGPGGGGRRSDRMHLLDPVVVVPHDVRVGQLEEPLEDLLARPAVVAGLVLAVELGRDDLHRGPGLLQRGERSVYLSKPSLSQDASHGEGAREATGLQGHSAARAAV